MDKISLHIISIRSSLITPKTVLTVRKVNPSSRTILRPLETVLKQKDNISNRQIKLYSSALSRFAVKCILMMAIGQTMLNMAKVRWHYSQEWNTKALMWTTWSTAKDSSITQTAKFAQTKHGTTESLSWRRRNTLWTQRRQTSSCHHFWWQCTKQTAYLIVPQCKNIQKWNQRFIRNIPNTNQLKSRC